jgi:GNAT superfamily N-acetyltransferase
MKIEYARDPGNPDLKFLTDKINAETPEYDEAYSFAFFIRDQNQQIIAGCNGSVVFGAIDTDQLWVNPGYRKQGLGKQLMQAVHAQGIAVGCKIATVATMRFQGAIEFYEKLGYCCDFVQDGYVNGKQCVLLRMEL